MHFTACEQGRRARRKEGRKIAITLDWPLNIQFVVQIRIKFHLIQHHPGAQISSPWTSSCTQTTILCTRHVYGSELHPKPCAITSKTYGEAKEAVKTPPQPWSPPPAHHLAPDSTSSRPPQSLGGLYGNPGAEMGLRNPKPLPLRANHVWQAAPARSPHTSGPLRHRTNLHPQQMRAALIPEHAGINDHKKLGDYKKRKC